MRTSRNFNAMLGLVIVMLATSAGMSDPLRYQFEKGQKIAYRFKITADLPTKSESCEGIITYEVKSTGKIVRLKYRGGLHLKTEIKKETIGKFITPFSTSSYYFRHKGLYPNNSNDVAMNQQGKMTSLQGDSQLPYLLGNLSTLVFETLPEQEKNSWSNDDVLVITELNKRFPFSIVLYDDQYNIGGEAKTAANESTTLDLQKKQENLIEFKKSYTLETPDDKINFKITGSGTWVFNQEMGLPESLDYKQTMTANESNVKVTVPVTVEYKRLSDEEYKEYEKEKKKKDKETQEKLKKLQAERKAPINDADKAEFLRELKSDDEHRQHKTLSHLMAKYDDRSDPEIAEAIRPLLTHSKGSVRRAAERAMTKFSPEFKRQHEFEKVYGRSFPLDMDKVGDAIRADTSLPSGLLVAVQRHSRWYPARILENLGNGEFQVGLQTFNQKENVHWTKIRLAPVEFKQPLIDQKIIDQLYSGKPLKSNDTSKKMTQSESLQGFRTWADNTGEFEIVAKYLGIEDSKVLLKRKDDGKEIKVPLLRLSKKDREIAKRLHKMEKESNPFE